MQQERVHAAGGAWRSGERLGAGKDLPVQVGGRHHNLPSPPSAYHYPALIAFCSGSRPCSPGPAWPRATTVLSAWLRAGATVAVSPSAGEEQRKVRGGGGGAGKMGAGMVGTEDRRKQV